MATKSLSGIGETLWLHPDAIEYRVSPSADLMGVCGGGWDTERRRIFSQTAKFLSMVQRYSEGADWEETILFVDSYARRLAKDGHVGRCTTIEALAEHYRNRFDPMFAAFKNDGFSLTDHRGRAHPLPTILIGRDGKPMIGNQGNHRMALAKVAGLDKIAGRIVCRHRLSPQ